MRYLGELMGPVGRTQVSYERVESSKPFGNTHKTPYIYMDIQGNKGVVQDPKTKKFTKQEIALKRPNQLALSTLMNQIKVFILAHYLFWLLYLKKPLNARKFY
ncbi:MAG: hypothetical protein ACKO99_21045, partial [Dolichospermum sp.]